MLVAFEAIGIICLGMLVMIIAVESQINNEK